MEKTPSPTDEFSESQSPMIASILQDVTPDSNGLLNISGKGIGRVSERQIRTFAHQVFSVDVSSNKFTALDFLKLLPRCHRVYAAKNQLRRLISLSPLKNVLEILDLAENQISSTEHYLSQFTKIKVLNLSNNFLHVFPSINELTSLTFIDISCNDFMALPNFKRLSSLLTLKMSNNEIYSLKDAQHNLPESLTTLELAENKISDLNEIAYLKFLTNLQHLSFEDNPCVMQPYNTFNYRVFAVAKLLSLLTVDEAEVNDSERLTAEFLHTHKKMATFYPDAGRHDALVKFLEKECKADVSDPLLNLTPSHPTLMAVKNDYLHNKTEDDFAIHDTPRKSVRSADRNVRVISPTLKRSATVDASFRLAPFDRTKFNSMKPLSKYLNDSNDSVASNSTVTITESESVNLNVALPVIESDSVQENDETQPIVVEELKQKTPPRPPTPKYRASDNDVFGETSSESRQSSPEGSPILPRLAMQKGWTQIVKESPFQSVISDIRPSSPKPAIESRPTDTTFTINDETRKIEDTTKTLDRAMSATEIMEKLQELKKDGKEGNEENWNEVMKSMKVMSEQLENLNGRVKLLESAQNKPANNALDAIQMFMPMPSNIVCNQEQKSSNYTLSWDTAVPMQPTIRGFAVYIDDRFHSEVKAPVVRIRGPLAKGQKISLQSISATNVRSLTAEIIINHENCEDDKENSQNFLQPGFLTARSM